MTSKLNRSLESLTNMCREFLKKEYNINLSIPIKINNRLTRALGRFIITTGNINNRIEFAGRLLREGTDEQVISVLKHECIHYALYELGRDYKDGQEEFENELRKHGADSTNCIRLERKEKQIDLNKQLTNEISDTVTKTIESVFDKILQEKVLNS